MSQSLSEKFGKFLLFGRNGRQAFYSMRSRRAGQSLEEKLVEYWDAAFFSFVLVGISIIGFIFLAISPKHISLLFITLLVYGIIGFARSLPKALSYTKGLTGEREVAFILEEINRNGGFVIHDIPAGGFNIDHVVISPRGVYAIETKYMTKRKSGKNELQFHAGVLTLGGAPLKCDPVPQAEQSAKELKRIFKSLGVDKVARPVVLVPGWFVERGERCPKGNWVLEPKAFPQWLAKERETMTAADAAALAGLLNQYVLASERGG